MTLIFIYSPPFVFCYRREGGTPQTRMQKTSASSKTDRSTRAAVRIGSYRDRHHFSYGRRRDRVSAMEMRARAAAHREARRRSDRSEAMTTQVTGARRAPGGFLTARAGPAGRKRGIWYCTASRPHLVISSGSKRLDQLMAHRTKRPGNEGVRVVFVTIPQFPDTSACAGARGRAWRIVRHP